MKIFAILLSAVMATLASANPIQPAVSICLTTSGINNPDGQEVTLGVQLNNLRFSNEEVTKLQVKAGSGVGGVDANNVECRTYKDKAGIVPGSLPFTTETAAHISTNTVAIGAILCYVVGQDE